jgi:hypothetical protein
MAEYAIVKQAETFRIGLDGSTRKVRQILYTVGDDGPFTLEVAAESYNPEDVRRMLEEDARRIRSIRGIT